MKKLKWDSDFWGIEVFHLEKSKEIKEELISSSTYMIQSLPHVSDLKFINYLENNSFNFVESKITLQKALTNSIYIANNKFKLLTLQDLIYHRGDFYNLFGKNSRFEFFTPAKVNEFYYTWLVNSIKGEMDDAVIGYYMGNRLAGFVSYRMGQSNLTIGLLAVFPEFQGKSVSQKLLNYVDYIALEKNIKSIQIATQGKNIHALNAYIKNGYHISSINHWYYYIKGETFDDSI